MWAARAPRRSRERACDQENALRRDDLGMAVDKRRPGHDGLTDEQMAWVRLRPWALVIAALLFVIAVALVLLTAGVPLPGISGEPPAWRTGAGFAVSAVGFAIAGVGIYRMARAGAYSPRLRAAPGLFTREERRVAVRLVRRGAPAPESLMPVAAADGYGPGPLGPPRPALRRHRGDRAGDGAGHRRPVVGDIHGAERERLDGSCHPPAQPRRAPGPTLARRPPSADGALGRRRVLRRAPGQRAATQRRARRRWTRPITASGTSQTSRPSGRVDHPCACWRANRAQQDQEVPRDVDPLLEPPSLLPVASTSARRVRPCARCRVHVPQQRADDQSRPGQHCGAHQRTPSSTPAERAAVAICSLELIGDPDAAPAAQPARRGAEPGRPAPPRPLRPPSRRSPQATLRPLAAGRSRP